MAPEIVARKEYTGFCADIWAMGVLLYALLCGSFPFRGQNDRDLYRKIVRGVFHIPDFVGEGGKSVELDQCDLSNNFHQFHYLNLHLHARNRFFVHLYREGKMCSAQTDQSSQV